jgi:site-specific DNA-cytosine methylase
MNLMGDVVQLRQVAPQHWTEESIRVFTCGCDCQTFFAMGNGSLVCTDCKMIQSPLLVSVRPGFTVS